MGVYPERMMFFQHFNQFIGNSIGKYGRRTCSDPYDFDVLDLLQFDENPVKVIRRQEKGITDRLEGHP